MTEFTVNLLDTISPSYLWLALTVVILISLFFSLVLIYHWHKYGHGNRVIATAEITFLSVMAVLILFSISLIKLFENS